MYRQIQRQHKYRLYTKEELKAKNIEVENHRVGVSEQMLDLLGTVITVSFLSEPGMFYAQQHLFKCAELHMFWFPCEWLSMTTELGNEF